MALLMPGFLATAALPVLRRLDPELAHGLALRGLALGLAGRSAAPADPSLATSAFGLRFASPIGLAAGFDKDAAATLPLMRLGFGAVEVGTVTPRPQPGNSRPRLFRLAEDHAAINRMGFNNAGLEAMRARLARLRRPLPAVLGANIGVNKDGADPERDYPALYAALAPLVDYVAINVSSPNTPGLRDLQTEARLAGILAAIGKVVPLVVPRPVPLLVKLAPDLADAAIPPLVETCVAHGVAGLILTNTTLARPDTLRSRHRAEAGGLSGAPLRARSNALLRIAFRAARGRLALIGVGGIASGADALAKIRAGASLLQLYTGFAEAGPALLPRLHRELVDALRAGGYDSVAAAVGTES